MDYKCSFFSNLDVLPVDFHVRKSGRSKKCLAFSHLSGKFWSEKSHKKLRFKYIGTSVAITSTKVAPSKPPYTCISF